MVNLDNISYYFQIPLNWYRKVHNACFKSIPENYIEIKPQNDGANIIGLDVDGLKEYLDVGSSNVSSITINDLEKKFTSDAEGNIKLEIDHDSISDWDDATADFITADSSSTGVIYNDSGTISYKAIGTSSGNIAAGDHTHNLTDGTLEGFGSAAAKGIGTGSDQVAAGNHNHDDRYVKIDEEGKYLTTDDIGETVQGYDNTLQNIVDGQHFDSNGRIEITAGTYVASTSTKQRFLNVPASGSSVTLTDTVNGSSVGNMTASKWVKTDGNGKLTTTDDDPITADKSSTGYVFNNGGTISYQSYKEDTYNLTAITAVTWDGSALKSTRVELTFKDGLLTAATAPTTETIDTAVLFET